MSEAAFSPSASAADLGRHAEATIARGSKSFALAARLFDPSMREDARLLYTWCRHCDDVIDGQTLGGDAPEAGQCPEVQARRLAALRRDAERALAGEAVGTPAFDGLAAVVRRRGLPAACVRDHLDGFALDVGARTYATLREVMAYCYGVAGSVGVMMAIVMGVDPDDAATLDRACDMGLAFQLTNIARDVADDARGGRVYLPADRLRAHGLDAIPATILAPENRTAAAGVAVELLDEADRYYASASLALRRLPPRAAAAVAAARNVYRDIGRLVRRRGAAAWDRRAVVGGPRKAGLAAAGLVAGLMAGASGADRPLPARDPGLWTRPGGLRPEGR